SDTRSLPSSELPENTRDFPSGDQATSPRSVREGPEYILLSEPPEAGTTNIENSRSDRRENATHRPSGENAGQQSVGTCVSWLSSSSPIRLTKIPELNGDLPSRRIASKFPSGENAGSIKGSEIRAIAAARSGELTPPRSSCLTWSRIVSTTIRPMRPKTSKPPANRAILNHRRRRFGGATSTASNTARSFVRGIHAGGGSATTAGGIAGSDFLIPTGAARSTSTMNRYPLRGRVSMYLGFSAESLKASRNLF